jgi:threonine synthase
MPDYFWRCGSPIEAGQLLAEDEGVFVEPAAATSVAGVSVARQLGHIDQSASVVYLLTGHGLKYQALGAEREPASAADGAELVRAIRRDVGNYG